MDVLPIDAHIPEVLAALARRRAVVVVADPGAGKTTRVPPALLAGGPLLLLQPRRAAARAIAQRIAHEQAWTIGHEIGWHIRLERRFTAATRLLVATEGILTARLQQDPFLSTFFTIVLDEFHERSIHADLGLAMAKQAWQAREDLRLVVMSATLDAEAVASFLDDCPIVRVPGRLHPIEIRYTPETRVADAAADLIRTSPGSVLCFQPGAFEIQRTITELRPLTGPDVDLMPLHGSLTAGEQDEALSQPRSGRRRVIVATNLAETSVTVPGVTAVVDAGLQKIARYDPERAIDRLAVERVTADAADQRAGRAGRIGPGLVRRLWDSRDRLRPHRDPDVRRVDLAGTILSVMAWGQDPHAFAWFEAPPSDAIDAALGLLGRLGALKGGALTAMGRQMESMPLHPRLARILIAGRATLAICQACALLSQRVTRSPRSAVTTSDVLSALDDWNALPAEVRHLAREIEQVGKRLPDDDGDLECPALSETQFRRAILRGYPDRVAQRREPHSLKVRLSSGAGAELTEESGVRNAEFLVALDVQASVRKNDPDSRIRVASQVERDWLEPTAREVVHCIDASGTVRATEYVRYDALVLSERPTPVDDQVAANLLTDAWLASGRSAEDERLIRRLAFSGLSVDLPQVIRAAAQGVRSLSAIQIARAIPFDVLKTLDRHAPETLVVPSGRAVRLDYSADGTVSASVKLQELFGLGDTPRVGPRQEPVLFFLLAPNGRPVQTTRDLRSFWNRTYTDIRKELRGRYPKHPWPEDPWHAAPTARATRRKT